MLIAGGGGGSVSPQYPTETTPPPQETGPVIDPSDRKHYQASQGIAETGLDQSASDLQDAETELAQLREDGASDSEIAAQLQVVVDLREEVGDAAEQAVSLEMDLENDPDQRVSAGENKTSDLAADVPEAAKPYVIDGGQRAIVAETAPPPTQEDPTVCTATPGLENTPLSDEPPPLTVDSDVEEAVRPVVEEAEGQSGEDAEMTAAAGNQILWSEQAGQNEDIAEALEQNATDALATYGENSTQYQLARARADAAWARTEAADWQAAQSGTELVVDQLGDDGGSATWSAQATINEALAPLGLEWTPPEATGSLEDAQERLETIEGIATGANQAANGRTMASDELDQWVDGLPALAELQQTVDSHGRPQYVDPETHDGLAERFDEEAETADLAIAQAQSDTHLAQANVYTTQADLAVLDVRTDSAQLTLDHTEEGSEAHEAAETMLDQAEELRPSAQSNLEIATAQRNLAVAKADFAELQRQRVDIERGAAMDQRERLPHLFEIDYVDGGGDYHGDLRGIEFEVRDGQLYQVNDYENGEMDYQLTWEDPDILRDDATEARQRSQDWATLYPEYRAAETAVLQAESALDGRRIDQLDTEIARLEEDYRAAVRDHGEGATEPPDNIDDLPEGEAPVEVDGRWVHPDVAEADAALDAARDRRDQVGLHLDYVEFMLSQPVEAREDPEELEALYYTENEERLQQTFNSYGDNEAFGGPRTLTVGSELDGAIAGTLGAASGQDGAIAPISEEIRSVTGTTEGDTVEVTAIPLVYVEAEVGRQDSALFRVQGEDGTEYLVDDTGSRYTSIEDYQNHNYLAESGTIYLPDDLTMTRNGDGDIAFSSHQAHVKTFQERYVDPVMTGVATVATIASFTPLAPVAVPIAVGSGTYVGAVRPVQRLSDMNSHGRSILSEEGAWEMATVATAVLPMAASATRFVGLARTGGLTAMQAARGSIGALRWSDASIGRFQLQATSFAPRINQALATNNGFLATARGLDVTAMGIGAPLVGKTGWDLAVHWEDMSGFDRLNTVMSFATGVYGTGMGYLGWRATSDARNTAGPVRTFDAKEVRALTGDDFATMSVAEWRAIKPSHLAQVKRDVIATIPEILFANLTYEQTAALKPTQMRGLGEAQLQAIRPANMPAIPPGRLTYLTPDQVAAFTRRQLKALTPDQVRKFTPDQMARHTAWELSGFSKAQKAALRPAQTSRLSTFQSFSLRAGRWMSPRLTIDAPVLTGTTLLMLIPDNPVWSGIGAAASGLRGLSMAVDAWKVPTTDSRLGRGLRLLNLGTFVPNIAQGTRGLLSSAASGTGTFLGLTGGAMSQMGNYAYARKAGLTSLTGRAAFPLTDKVALPLYTFGSAFYTLEAMPSIAGTAAGTLFTVGSGYLGWRALWGPYKPQAPAGAGTPLRERITLGVAFGGGLALFSAMGFADVFASDTKQVETAGNDDKSGDDSDASHGDEQGAPGAPQWPDSFDELGSPSDLPLLVQDGERTLAGTDPSDFASALRVLQPGEPVELVWLGDGRGFEWRGVDGQTAEAFGSTDPTGRVNADLETEGYPWVVVMPGDTIRRIATSRNADVVETVMLNMDHILQPDIIYPGDRIYLPETANDRSNGRPFSYA